MRGSSGSLALLTRGELGKIAVIVTLPMILLEPDSNEHVASIHLVVEDLGLAGLGLGDEGLVENIEDILADLLEFRLDLLAVIADGSDVLVRAL
jgi:hypothetical protein